jgi:hypothetical protein
MVRDRLSGDVADLSSLIKGLLIRAEDARLMRDMYVLFDLYLNVFFYSAGQI